MGKRSRKRSGQPEGSAASAGSSRAERDAARARRAQAERRGERAPKEPRARAGRVSAEDRPPPLWAPFPLTELVILAGIALMVWGLLSGGGEEGSRRLAAGLAIASLAGLELSVREHVTGFRSHSALLAGAVAILAMLGAGLGLRMNPLGLVLATGVVVFAVAFWGLRKLFQAKSGGLSFR
jgi:hypothetical protein